MMVSLLQIFAYGTLIGFSFTAYYIIFVKTTLNGVYSITLFTNLYGEHYLELIWFGLALPLAVWFILHDTGMIKR